VSGDQIFHVSQVKSGCGIFGVLRKSGAPTINPSVALAGIECVRYRGSRLGAGFCVVTANSHRRRVKLFAKSEQVAVEVYRILRQSIGDIDYVGPEYVGNGDGFSSYIFELNNDVETRSLRSVINHVNSELSRGGFRGRIYCWGRNVEVFKGVGYPRDVYEVFKINERVRGADAFLSHTRQPTNSPGTLPIWSHPFSSGEWAVVHNGDISSFGSNMEFLSSVGFSSFVGTDSEVIAYLFDYLTSDLGLGIKEACEVLINQFEDKSSISHESFEVLRGASLDGPFSVIATFSDGSQNFMVAMADRYKFRPIVLGEDEHYVYAASEEVQIKSVSPKARVWTLEPGEFMIASSIRGVLHYGRKAPHLFTRHSSSIEPPKPIGRVIDASGLDYHSLNRVLKKCYEGGIREVSVINVCGQRYIGAGIEGAMYVRIYGTPGNCLANFNMSIDFEVYGSVQDDVGDVMHGGSIVIHGDARDVLGQALQGGYIFVKGNAGNRCGIQMREYHDRKPYLVVGGCVDDYLGEYMAGGVIVVLGIGYYEDSTPIVGRYIGSGMVGGKIFVRGDVPRDRISCMPPRRDVLQYITGLYLDGEIDSNTLRRISAEYYLDLETLARHLPPDQLRKVAKLFQHKYYRRIRIEKHSLLEDGFAELVKILQCFGKRFSLTREIHKILDEEFTLIEPISPAMKEQKEPPSEEG